MKEAPVWTLERQGARVTRPLSGRWLPHRTFRFHSSPHSLETLCTNSHPTF